MDFIQHSSGLYSPSYPIQNLVNTAPPPAIVMAPTPAPVRETIPYAQRFPKKFMLILSSIQLAMAVLAIISQVIGLSVRYPGPEVHYVGTGIWCGVFFALSGLFGTIASTKPSFGWIVTFMVFAIISASLCLPMLVLSSIGMTIRPTQCYDYDDNDYYDCHDNTLKRAAHVILVAVSLIQAAAAITSAGMTCRAVCCGSKGKSRVVYYNGSAGSNANNGINQRITMPDRQRGYITIPMSQVQAVPTPATAPLSSDQTTYTSSSAMITEVHQSPVRRPTGPPPTAPNISRMGSQVQSVAASTGATAVPTMTMLSSTAETNISGNSPPPKYEDVPQMKNDNGSNYQQFHFQ